MKQNDLMKNSSSTNSAFKQLAIFQPKKIKRHNTSSTYHLTLQINRLSYGNDRQKVTNILHNYEAFFLSLCTQNVINDVEENDADFSTVLNWLKDDEVRLI